MKTALQHFSLFSLFCSKMFHCWSENIPHQQQHLNNPFYSSTQTLIFLMGKYLHFAYFSSFFKSEDFLNVQVAPRWHEREVKLGGRVMYNILCVWGTIPSFMKPSSNRWKENFFFRCLRVCEELKGRKDNSSTSTGVTLHYTIGKRQAFEWKSALFSNWSQFSIYYQDPTAMTKNLLHVTICMIRVNTQGWLASHLTSERDEIHFYSLFRRKNESKSGDHDVAGFAPQFYDRAWFPPSAVPHAFGRK